jgi:calcineurin-like phosphoesterase family protein
VASNDEVWHLGDFALGAKLDRIADLLAELKGRKHLIIRNNDGEATMRPALTPRFTSCNSVQLQC